MRTQRPRLKVPFNMFEKALETASVLILITTFTVICFHYSHLPDTIPTHYGASGQPDRWGNKTSIFALPILMAVMYTGLTIVARYPHTFNYLCEINEVNAPFQYVNARILLTCLKTIMISLFAYMEWGTIQVATGKSSGLGVAFLTIYLLLIFGTLVFFIIRMLRGK